jgi:hypothetical protein
MNSLVTAMALAMATFEGFNTAGTLAQRNNNPGNLRAGPGAIGTDATGYAIFATVDAGWAALYNQIQLNINRGLNLLEFFAGKPGVYPGYAPAADQNQPERYAAFVASKVGIPSDVPLTDLQTSTASPPAAVPRPGPESSPIPGPPKRGKPHG